MPNSDNCISLGYKCDLFTSYSSMEIFLKENSMEISKLMLD